MAIYIGKRILSIVPIVLFASFLMFVMIKVGPVDPAEAYLAAAHIHPDDEVLAAKRHEFGLDQPLLVQYAQSVMKMCRLDFGTSYITNEPVWQEVVLKFPATIQLALCSILLAILVSVPIGFLSAIFKNGAVDYSSRVLSYIGACIPIFWLGYLLVYFFSVKLDWLPVEGRGTWQHLVLPSVTLALWLIAIYTRLLRTTVLEELQEAYVRYARTRGIKERVIMLKYVLRIAILPMITALGMNMGKLLTGAIIVEQVFSWPGFGRYFVQSIVNRDIPVIQCYVLLSVCIVVGCNLIVDLLQLYMDPRISRKGRADQ
ncbi:nickel transport system permease [Paenibacillus mucilaginosus 3016]|uniref:Nickel import system permease protein NikB n=1 Tax=Paenibacillus mucilaginosus 3016 TaxID=1116391 RepID=H6NPG9_9BACL|nr:nickel ABC transporter permease subunit NikB [Paenibacillus mucilaginosus]AFC32581.1 nickel transport system permease [Paenibacillus mucilaginosus 3016]WFA21059.1 nickel ABC transporter permease subunit NikB [Paenibacillus mucilaginosus]